jgi:hypothetical protein
MSFALDPYDSCPCGSGKKFKFCCAKKAGENIPSARWLCMTLMWSNSYARARLTICEFSSPLLTPCQTSISAYRILQTTPYYGGSVFSSSRPHAAALFGNRIHLLPSPTLG